MGARLNTIVNRIKGATDALRGRAPEGRVYAWSRQLDAFRAAMTTQLTFSRLGNILRSAGDGYITEALLLFEEMESLDARLKSNAEKRRMALTGLEYEIVSAAEAGDVKDEALAEAAADYVRETLDALDGFPGALEHLATAIGPNLAVCEMEWESSRPVAIFNVPAHRLTMDLNLSPAVRIITQESLRGLEMSGPKFVVHVPHAVSGSPLLKSLSTAQATIWLIKKLAIADWATFCEVFGMPVRVGKYRPAAAPEEKKVLADMLANIGAAAWAMVSEATSIEFAETTNRGVSPFEALINYCDREQAVLWLGGNLTGDTTGGTGTFAAAKVQDDVRDDLRNDDIRREGRTLREQIIRPLVEFQFPGRDAALPIFRRIKPETVDRIKEAQAMKAAQNAGVVIPRKWAYDRLNIPEPDEGEEVLEPADAFAPEGAWPAEELPGEVGDGKGEE